MRKRFAKKLISLLATISMTFCLVACGGSGAIGESSTPKADETGTTEADTATDEVAKEEVHIAYSGEPQSFDPVLGTAVATRTITRAVYEGLLELDGNYEIKCQLCKNYEVSDGGKTWTFNLREGVPFHNGDIMDADDVVASLNYWKEMFITTEYFSSGSEFEKVDDKTVKITFDSPKNLFGYYLSGQTGFAAIMPKEVVESATEAGVTEYIGTGPYKWSEYKPTQYVALELFEDYVGPDFECNGGDAGNRICTIPKVVYEFVTDPVTRLSGVTTGQYDIATDIPYDNLPQVEATSGVEAYEDWMFSVFVFMNQKVGPFQDENLRKAVRLAIDSEEMAASGIPNSNYCKLTGSFDSDIFPTWYVAEAEQYVNNKNIEEAKKLVEESSYDGSELKLVTTDMYPDLKAMTMVMQQQLAEVGINCKVESYDWATTLTKLWNFDINGNDNYDIYIMSYPYVSAPISSAVLTNPFSIAYSDLGNIAEPFAKMQEATDEVEIVKNWKEVQTILYEKEMVIKLLDEATVTISTDKVHNLDNFSGPVLWRTTVSE